MVWGACRALHERGFGDAQHSQARVVDGGVEPVVGLVGIAECRAEPLALCSCHTALVGHRGSAPGRKRRLARVVECHAAALGCAANELDGERGRAAPMRRALVGLAPTNVAGASRRILGPSQGESYNVCDPEP